MDVYIWILALCVTFSLVQAQSCRREQKCRVTRIRSMKAADCYDKDMTKFSQCLPKDVEIVDLSHNRIRKLAKDDLNKYSNLKILYLNDNSIAVIDKETFDGSDYLHTLDLSLNSITKLPTVVFQLPSLQSLYLGQNLNMNIADVVEKSIPITSPLYHLDISGLFEEAAELPYFGLLTTLGKYNISGNKLVSPKPKHFAGICNLKILDTTNVTIEDEDDPCDCWKINRWLQTRRVSFRPFICSRNGEDCSSEIPPEDLELHQKCQEAVQEAIKKSKIKTTLLIVLPISGALILLVGLYIYLSRRRKQKKKQNERREPLMLNNAAETKLT